MDADREIRLWRAVHDRVRAHVHAARVDADTWRLARQVRQSLNEREASTFFDYLLFVQVHTAQRVRVHEIEREAERQAQLVARAEYEAANAERWQREREERQAYLCDHP